MSAPSPQPSHIVAEEGSRLPSPVVFAEKLLERVKVSRPPVSLATVLAIWKELSVVEEDLDGAGYLLPLGKLGAEIIVNKNDRDERKKFTVAHELGHWVLGLALQKKQGEFRQPQGVHGPCLEKWCDAFAANLLMPSTLVVAWLPPKDDPFMVDGILRASKEFGVSREAFFIRIWNLLKIQVAILKPGTPTAVGRCYSDEEGKSELIRLLGYSTVQDQLATTGQVISFALRDTGGRIFVSGRRSAGSVTLCVVWPTSHG